MGPERERRIVTVLFCDLVGFTSLSERLDAEDMTLVQDAYFAAARETIARHGGQLEKFVGDAVMAVFGAPRSHDDDAERAVRAGLALTAAVERVGAELGLEPGALRLRVGIASGEAVYGEATADRGPVTGDTVNLAARLQAAAEPGSVVVGEITALAVAEAVQLEQLKALELKGKSSPVAAWRVVDVYAERSRERALGGMRAPTLGRERELAELRALIGSTARVVLVAPPGVGKTRLLSELARSSDSVVLTARLRPDLLGPFEPVAQLLRSGGGDAAVAAPPPGTEREQMFEMWLDSLDALAGDRPAIWLVEDVHWASPDLLAFLDAAGRVERAAGRLVVATSRPVLLEQEADWVDRASRLDLQPLGEADTAGLVRALVGDALPPEIVDTVAERSGGNALFVEELLRLWVSAGVLVPHGEGWRLTAREGGVPLPPTVQAVYAGQLDDLPASARTAARRASVAGRRFPTAALAPLDVPDAVVAVDTLARRALLAGPLDDPSLGESFAYRHALLRDAGYASLARSERARLHLRLAGWLASLGDDVTGTLAEVIARHYAAAADSAPRLVSDLDGVPLAEVRSAAAGWFERAAAVAVEFAAWDSAKTLAAHAVELTAPEALVDRARRRQAQGVATASATGIDQALPLLHEAIEEFRAGGSREGIADAAWALGNLLRAKTLFAQAEQLANDLLAEVGGDDAATARLLLMRSHAELNARDDHALARADAGRALELLRGDRLELDALHLVAQVEAEAEGSNDEAWRQVAELATARQAWNIAANAIRQRGAILVDDEPYAALAFIDEAEELAQQHGLVEAGAWCDYMRAEAFLSSGDWDDAVAAGLRAIEVGEAHDMHRPVVRSWFALRPIAVARGDLALLAQAYPRFAARAGVEPDSPYARIVSTAMHVSFADAGLERHFVPDVEQRLRSFELDHTSPSWLAAIETIVGAWITAGELDGARRALDVMRARLSRGSPTRLALVTHAVLRARRGEPIAPDVATESPWWRWKVLRELDPSSAEAEMIALRLRLER